MNAARECFCPGSRAAVRFVCPVVPTNSLHHGFTDDPTTRLTGTNTIFSFDPTDRLVAGIGFDSSPAPTPGATAMLGPAGLSHGRRRARAAPAVPFYSCMMAARRTWPPRDRGRRVAELLGKGYSLEAVAEAMNLPLTTVRRSFAMRVARSKTPQDAATRRRRDAEIVGLYKRGLGLVRVSAQTGVPVENVRQVLIARGVPRRVSAADHPDLVARDEKMARLYAEGMTTTRIAERTGMTPAGVKIALRRRGVKMRTTAEMQDRARPVAERLSTRNRTLAAMYRRGLSANEIGETLGISRGTVLYALAKLRVKRRTARDYDRPEPRRSAAIREKVAALAPTYDTGPGTSTGDFATRLGITRQTVQKYLRRCGVTLRSGGGLSTPLTEADVSRIKRLVCDPTNTFREVSEAFGVSITMIQQIALGRTWRHVPWPRGKRYVRRRKTPNPR